MIMIGWWFHKQASKQASKQAWHSRGHGMGAFYTHRMFYFIWGWMGKGCLDYLRIHACMFSSSVCPKRWAYRQHSERNQPESQPMVFNIYRYY